ncbi:MAG: VOC family protein [Saprospiraceae bacterium]|jgi:glyoxylase I family protein|nr:VOC family protein [Saprospiraceae bacterium]
MPSKLQLISHVALNCLDIETTAAFYQKYLGFTVARVIELPDDAKIVFLKMQDCAFYLELFQSEGERPIAPAENDGYAFPAYRHMAFKIDNVDDFLAELEDNVETTLGPLSFDDFIPGWKTAWIRDPDGRVIEISEGFKDQIR